MDPILDEFVSGGGNRIDPPRTLNKKKVVSDLDAIIISHRHDDHFSPLDLLQIENLPDTPIFIPDHPQLERELRGLGARRICRLLPWQSAEVGDCIITATPSEVAFAEMGMLFRVGDCTLLNLVDTAYWNFANELHRRFGSPKLALVPFQAGGYVEFYPLRIGGPPEALEREIRIWSETSLEMHAAALASIAPQYVAAFADGLSYTDTSVNAWHFPKPTGDFIARILQIGVPTLEALPGTQFTIRSNQGVDVSFAKDLVSFSGERAERTFRPNVTINDRPTPWLACADPRIVQKSPCYSFPDSVARVRLHLERLNERRFNNPESSIFEWIKDWALLLYDYDNSREVHLMLRPAPSNGDVLLLEVNADFSRTSYGAAFFAADLAVVFENELSFNVLLHGAHYRYWSPGDEPISLLFERTLGRMFDLLHFV